MRARPARKRMRARPYATTSCARNLRARPARTRLRAELARSTCAHEVAHRDEPSSFMPDTIYSRGEKKGGDDEGSERREATHSELLKHQVVDDLVVVVGGAAEDDEGTGECEERLGAAVDLFLCRNFARLRRW